MRGFPAWADSAIGNFRRGMQAGVVLPRPLVEKMIPQLRAMVRPTPPRACSTAPSASFRPTLPAADQQRLTAAYQQAIGTELVPTYQKLADFPAERVPAQGPRHAPA